MAVDHAPAISFVAVNVGAQSQVVLDCVILFYLYVFYHDCIDTVAILMDDRRLSS